MLIQVAPFTPCVVSTADAESIRAANALAALAMYWDRSCALSLTPNGRWRATRRDGGVVTAGNPAGLHRKLVRLAGAVPPLGRESRGAHESRCRPASWITGLVAYAGIWP
jgi:hypothetical protein